MQDSRALANGLRALAMDAVQKANSGHPGAPMGMADIAEVLWRHFLQHNPKNPAWINRDRFVLSNGHASMLLYGLLHLTGYDLPLEALKQFRQLHSKTPGHPEYGITPGVETTTGPLGQGFANAVGMALSEKRLAEQFNRPQFPIIDHYTYVFLGDGCLMEGISQEAASLAGTWKLNKLIAFWDDNGISIDGPTVGWFTEDVPSRFRAMGWHVIENVDGHNANEIRVAIEVAQAEINKPTLICCRTVIGFGAPTVQGSCDCHGSPLGNEEVIRARVVLEWPYAAFEIPPSIAKAWDATETGAAREAKWNTLFKHYQEQHPELAEAFMSQHTPTIPADVLTGLQVLAETWQKEKISVATRKASQRVLEHLVPQLPQLLGGSADLTGSNLTNVATMPLQHIHYGVREFGMGAIMNGLALSGGFIPYGGTFLTFIDYAKNALRLAALMRLRVIWVLTHDSVGLGEDGPTHQPIEHLTALRVTPNVMVWRPADAVETAVAWGTALSTLTAPSVLALSRQNLPTLARSGMVWSDIAKGAYVLEEASSVKPMPQLIVMSAGSEVQLAVSAKAMLETKGYAVRVVSCPCLEQFMRQPAHYRESVLPKGVPVLAIEAGSRLSWVPFTGSLDRVVGIDQFGESAPGAAVLAAMGITAEAVVEKALGLLG